MMKSGNEEIRGLGSASKEARVDTVSIAMVLCFCSRKDRGRSKEEGEIEALVSPC